MRLKILFFALITLFVYQVYAQTTERPRPAEWSNLVFGGRFMDRFLPMPNLEQLTRDTWGAENVLPRYTDNGIENRKWSFWGGNIKLGEDGKYHLYVCGWPESSPKGHNEWPNSTVFNAVSDNSFGPFVVKDTIGKGHNPEIFKLKDGRYVLYVIDGYYIADGCNGPWKYGKFEFLNRDRRLIEGNSNFTFAQREDGSYLMICRGGGQWFSQTGLSAYNQVTGTRIDSAKKIIPLRAYPQRPGNFEDPVVWRDNVQYNLIVNDWLGRIAVYERSKDGINWKIESGEAYLPGVSKHEDGTVEGWWKYERLKIFQDKYGRATQGNFAVIDVEKKFDKASDIHSSKNIGIPLTVGRLLTILDKKPITANTKSIKVKVAAEEGFNPQTDIDISSLQFGEPEAVNFGKGGKMIKTENSGSDLIVTFDAVGNNFPDDEFAAKMLGKTSDGKLLFGYARLPGIKFIEPILSPLLPVITANSLGFDLKVEVQNFGQVASKTAKLKIFFTKDDKEVEVAAGKIPSLKPWGKTTVDLNCGKLFDAGVEYIFKVVVNSEDKQPVVLHGNLTPVK
ncbi:MAG TPA: glycoside hydrolase family protein [Prolixibacteraceae bacterium]|nr:glycoside hydrolase family protein [Prolixibacteraceae bacterium]